jgi:hypothetical protein
MNADLWAVHIQGPDDILAVPDYVTAVQVADRFNGYWRSKIEKSGITENDPRPWAEPIKWSGSIEQHTARAVKPDEEYAQFFVDPDPMRYWDLFHRGSWVGMSTGHNEAEAWIVVTRSLPTTVSEIQMVEWFGRLDPRNCKTSGGNVPDPAPPLFDDAFLGKTVADAIRMFSSPTIGRGTREGQRGFIVYEDEVEFITLAIRKAVGHTPAAMWRARGEPDPHGIRYEAERASLMGGDMTDDQVSDMLAMLRRDSLKFEGVLAIAKDRIRWLSRKLAEATERRGAAAEERG